MKKTKISAAIIIALALLTAITGAAVLARQSVDVYLNGQKLDLEVQPYIENDRTMVPAATFCEKMGWLANWDENEKSVNFYNGQYSVDFVLDTDFMTVFDEHDGSVTEIALDAPACIDSGRIMVPVRALSEAFGTTVLWDEANSIVSLTNAIPDTDYSNEEYDADETASGLNVNDDTYQGFEDFNYSDDSYDDFVTDEAVTE
ncbi:MAG: copper amine oxidase N-terminal domain-containing protein [Clostridiales bacterium]|nr:copper amine oxidase N-terminal domain-containing protein [Clostridiales bacterium]